MQTVLSYIIQKRYSQEYENIATDVLEFILDSNEAARNGMMKLLRGIENLPNLDFETQLGEDNMRPDMWGIHENEPRVFIENKFWAGLTDNQPVDYLKKLAGYTQPTILLMVGPEARVHTLWRELIHRLKDAEISVTDHNAGPGIVYSTTTGIGPILALTSWSRVLSTLELEVADDKNARSDLLQLRALCEGADINAFMPVSSTVLTDQRTPAFILQLNSIIQTSIDLAVSANILNINGLRAAATWDGLGRYARINENNGPVFWFGTYFPFWREHGGTPLWLIFLEDEFGRSHEVRTILESWAAKEGIFTAWQYNEFYMAIDIETGEDKDRVVRAIVDRLKKIASVLSNLESKT
ncbi:MAG: hypothetical protein NTY09_10860 [bacterium]|nr:hypothetical protein [bacterium]